MPEDEEQRAFLLAQQIAIITGAAKGIGRGIAVEMAQERADVVLADIDEERMNETKHIISANGRRCLSIHTNIQEIEQGRRLVDTVLQQFGKVDILVNNAGISTPGARHILEISPEAYDRVLHTNLRGPFFLSQYMAQKMIELAPLLRSVRIEEETDQLLEMCGAHYSRVKPFDEEISVSSISLFSSVMM